jgi:putative salt-induced outer membrane protein
MHPVCSLWSPLPCSAAAALCACLTLGTAVAQADEITVKGTTLSGTVLGVTSKGIEFETIYGGGKLVIAPADVERLDSEGLFHVFHDDDGESVGRLVGVEDGRLLLDGGVSGTASIGFDSIHSSVTQADYEKSTLSSLRGRWRFWETSLDLAYSMRRATTDTTAMVAGFHTERRKSPTVFLFDTRFQYETTNEDDEGSSTTANEIVGRLRGEYELTNRVFTWGQAYGEYDEDESLSLRAVPGAGLGYRLIQTERTRLQVESGVAWIFERFFGGSENRSLSVPFGSELEHKLPRDMVLRARVSYLPAVEEWLDDYLLHTEVSLAVPLLDFLKLKATLIDKYDNTPADDNEHNDLNAMLGLALTF